MEETLLALVSKLNMKKFMAMKSILDLNLYTRSQEELCKYVDTIFVLVLVNIFEKYTFIESLIGFLIF